MTPKGYYAREAIHPTFTTQEYRDSPAYKEEVDRYLSMENRLKGLIRLPRKLWYKVWAGVIHFYFGKAKI